MRTFALLFLVGCEATGTTSAALVVAASDASDVKVEAGELEADPPAQVDAPVSGQSASTDAGDAGDAGDASPQDPPTAVGDAGDAGDASPESSCPGVKDPTSPDIPCGCQAAPNDPSCLLDGSDCRWGYSGAGTVCAQECVILRCR